MCACEVIGGPADCFVAGYGVLPVRPAEIIIIIFCPLVPGTFANALSSPHLQAFAAKPTPPTRSSTNRQPTYFVILSRQSGYHGIPARWGVPSNLLGSYLLETLFVPPVLPAVLLSAPAIALLLDTPTTYHSAVRDRSRSRLITKPEASGKCCWSAREAVLADSTDCNRTTKGQTFITKPPFGIRWYRVDL